MISSRPVWSISLLLLGSFVGACGGGDETFERAEIESPPVEAVPARLGRLPLVERLSGTVRAENQVALYPETTGRITRVHVENGERVRAGQPLVEVLDQQYREQVRQAEAGHRIAQARVRQAKARLDELLSQAQRTSALGELVTELERETLRAQVESARADVELAEAQLEQAAATLAEREDQLERTIVRAPVAGLVGQRNAEVGMQATSSTRLFTIGQIDRVSIRIDITDSMLRYIEPGQPVQIHFDGPTGRETWNARLTRISPFLNPVTRTAEAEIEVENREHRLRPGLFVPVDILYGESQEATLVPTSALYTDRNTGREGVFVITGDLAAEVDPTAANANPAASGPNLSEPVGVTFRSVPVIARGQMELAVGTVEPGEWVVTLGQDMLSTGRSTARVRTVDWEHVMALQRLRREDLLQQVLQPRSNRAVMNNP